MNNQKMLDVVTMIANIILPDKCDHESALETWLRAMKRKAREALESHEREPMTNGHAIGNAAAMRDALVWMSERMNAAVHDGSFDCFEALDKIDAALSAPARNCDMYDSYGDAIRAFEDTEDAEEYEDMAEWLFAPAAERKGDCDGK